MTPASTKAASDEPATIALRLARGVRRLLIQMRFASVVELTLVNGRRADVVGVAADGRIVIVEIKSGPADLRADRKWREYLPYCDEFYFAVSEDGPVDLIPPETGLILADAYGASIFRPAPVSPVQPSRRRATLLSFAMHAAGHLHRTHDPMAFG